MNIMNLPITKRTGIRAFKLLLISIGVTGLLTIPLENSLASNDMFGDFLGAAPDQHTDHSNCSHSVKKPDTKAPCAYTAEEAIDHSGHDHASAFTIVDDGHGHKPGETCSSTKSAPVIDDGHNHKPGETCSSTKSAPVIDDGHGHKPGETCSSTKSAPVIDDGHNHKPGETCSSTKSAAPSCGSETDDHAGHGHAEGSVFSLTEAQRRKSRCEHNMPTADCRDCSFEVGVVHISPDLLKGVGAQGALVQTGVVEKIMIDDTVDTIGHIALAENKTAHISPRTNGSITNVFVNLGDEVKIGDSLFELVSVEIGRAAASYKRAKSLVRLAKQELARSQKMRKLKITSDKEVFRLAYELEQAQIELSSALQELLILGIDKSDITSSKTFEKLARGISTIKAPAMGKITEKHAVTGEVINPGTAVLVIANLEKVWVWARVYDSDISLVLGHQNTLLSKEASVRVAAFPRETFTGIIDYISPMIDKETRTLSVRLTINNLEDKLLPGMFCRIALPLGKHSMLAVPRYSVLNDGETNFVFTPFGENAFAAREVKTGPVHGESLPIISGLSAGDTLVTKGTFVLKSEVLKERMGAG